MSTSSTETHADVIVIGGGIAENSLGRIPKKEKLGGGRSTLVNSVSRALVLVLVLGGVSTFTWLPV